MKIVQIIIYIIIGITSFGMFFIGDSSLSQELDDLDKAILNCLKSKREASHSNILIELEKFEEYLIGQGTIADGSGQSYINVFKIIAETGDFIHYKDYNNKTILDSLSKEEFGLCYYQFNNTEMFNRSDSKYKELTMKMNSKENLESISKSGEVLRSTAVVYLDVLTAKDFENPIFRYSTLYFLYFSAFDINFKR
jgi:hypothetical protein